MPTSTEPRGQTKPRVAVIVPHFNQPRDLRHCLDALEQQDYPHSLLDIVVVDNASEQNLRPEIGAQSLARLVMESRPGSYAARNRGIRETTAPLIAFTDADCRPAEDWISSGVKHLQGSMAQPAMIAGDVQMVLPEGRVSTAALYDYAIGIRQNRFLTRSHFAATANLMASRELFVAIGEFDEQLLSGGDREWGNRVHRAGFTQEYAADCRVYHPVRESLSEVLAKARRTGAGHRQLRSTVAAAGDQSAWTDRLRFKLQSALATLAELQRDPETRAPGRQLGIFVVAGLVIIARWYERLRLQLGGRPWRL